MSGNKRDDGFPLAEARNLVKDLMAPNPLIYWVDFLFYVTVGWGAFVLGVKAETFSGLQFLFYVVSSVALYRSVIFIHELAHLKKGTFKLFRLVWNLTCGFALVVPSFTYHGVHNDHHKRDIYGTTEDGEYMPFGASNPSLMVLFMALIFVLPLAFAVRFLVMTPLSYASRAVKEFIWCHMSSLTIDVSYCRPQPAKGDDPTWRLQELAAFIYAATAAVLIATGVLGWEVLVLWYAVTVTIFLLNSLRTLAAHSYRNPGAQTMTVGEQFLDSVNVPGNLVMTAAWAPVGLRYHATHHLFPNMPYHALGKAHRRLAANLSDAELYLKTSRKSLPHALAVLWRDARASQSAGAVEET